MKPVAAKEPKPHYGRRCHLLRRMEFTARVIDDRIAEPHQMTPSFLAAIDRRLAWEARELEQLGYPRFAARVRSAISGIVPDPGFIFGGPRGGRGGSGQGAGLRTRFAPAVACVGNPRVWR